MATSVDEGEGFRTAETGQIVPARDPLASGPSASRPHISERTKQLVWASAAGRCTFCNCLVTESENLGEPVPIGELAHDVGWGEGSPRGDSDLDADQRRAAENLLLTCRNCHKPIDDGGAIGRYTIDELLRRKYEHERRIRHLTAIGADRAAHIVRLVGHVRGVAPALTRETVLTASTAAGLYPQSLPTAHWEDVDLDLRPLGDINTPAEFEACLPAIRTLAARVIDGVRREGVDRLAIFAFARIPLLVFLGAQLDDKVQTLIFQRHRVDNDNAWRWPEHPGDPVKFDMTLALAGSDTTRVALVVCLSGTVRLDELPAEVLESHFVYLLAPRPPVEPGPTLVARPETLANLETALRQFLAHVEAAHGKVPSVFLFPAIPISAAITIGRVLMPHVSPSWRVFDRDPSAQFFEALEVRR